ncbi:protein kinase [Streptomyces sp. NPDC091371]|uniref:serine/threonine-protein kinase n=1 Tax=Streptomyces sp. NPDC091371 TaxID=3155303 RepID=UPI00343E8C02
MSVGGAGGFWEYLGLTLLFGLLVFGGPALLVRLLTMRVLVRRQQGVRERALAVQAGNAPPARPPAAVFGELAVGVGGIASLWLTPLFLEIPVPGMDLLVESIGLEDGYVLAAYLHVSLASSRIWFVIGALPVLLGWLFLYFLTQRTLLTAGMPSGVWRSPSNRQRLAGFLALRLVLGVFLPVGLVLAAVVVQTVNLLASRKYGAAAPRPLAQPAPPVPSYAPTQTAPPARPVQPAQPVPAYVPTQAARGAAPAPQVSYQELHPNEPRTIGGYHLLGRIGAGGMGTVYLARREGSATQVALKTIHPELLDHAELLRRFEREAEVLGMVSGAYTARVLDAGVDAGRPYLAMELLDGRPLDVHLREQGPVRSPEALRAMALALAVALSGVHRLGLVHRDLKPANIMLTTAGPRLLDFGIAAIVDGTRLTRTGGGPGTLTYMAPEQFGDEGVGPAADVWAWACCVVCAAHGASPFAATSTGAVIRRIVDTGPDAAALAAVDALDPALAAAVRRALTVDPKERPSDGAALVELLTGRQEPGVMREQITQGWRTLAL